jgi:hypothetical protein
VNSLRASLSSIAVVASLLATIGGPLLAQATHPVCTAKHHECDKTATVSDCCCGDQGSPLADSTPAQSRVEVRGDLSPMLALPSFVHTAPAPQPLSPVQTSPPRLCLLDLPTLFATLLI